MNIEKKRGGGMWVEREFVQNIAGKRGAVCRWKGSPYIVEYRKKRGGAVDGWEGSSYKNIIKKARRRGRWHGVSNQSFASSSWRAIGGVGSSVHTGKKCDYGVEL